LKVRKTKGRCTNYGTDKDILNITKHLLVCTKRRWKTTNTQ